MLADLENYGTDIAIQVRRPDGRIDTLIVDPRLHWVDAPFLDRDGMLWLPAAQMDRVSLFNDFARPVADDNLRAPHALSLTAKPSPR